MAGYTKEQQKLDLKVLDDTRDALSARLLGEKQSLCESYVLDYVRIARMWANKPHVNPGMVKQFARVGRDMAYANRITAWQMAEYGQIIARTRKMVQASLFRKKKKSETCAEPQVHQQPCFCLNLQRSKEREAGIQLEKATLAFVKGDEAIEDKDI